jgi:hypothetical protein
MTVAIVRNMFDQMVVKKDPQAIPRFYDPEFIMYSNGVVQDYASFAEGHEQMYGTDIQYAIEYDEDAWVEADGKVAARRWITTTRPHESANRIELILIAAFHENRIIRLWETTWPNWADLKAFDSYNI